MGPLCHYTIGGINSKHTIEFFRILRIAVVRLSTSALSYTHAHHVLPVVYRSYAPQLLPVAAEGDDVMTEGGNTSSYVGRRRRRPENMKETFSKAIVDLLNSGQLTYHIIVIFLLYSLSVFNKRSIQANSYCDL